MSHPATTSTRFATAAPLESGVFVRPVSASKRAFDVLGASLILLALSPLLAILALLVRFTSKGPVFFRLKAMGRGGKTFEMLKFRTMVQDAERHLQAVMDQNQGSGPMIKLVSDPRITPLGKWLRRSSLDELPQLVNVLRGEMSLVGPRPISAQLYEPQWLEGRWARRLEVLPGITGLWQVTGRCQDFEVAWRLDCEYIERQTLAYDVELLLRTIPAVLGAKGAS